MQVRDLLARLRAESASIAVAGARRCAGRGTLGVSPQQRHSEGTMKSRQSGITLIGFLVVLVVVGFFGFMAMKLIPAYTEFMGVNKAMNDIASGSLEGRSLDDVRRDLMKKMDFQYVDDSTIKPKDITIKREGNAAHLSVAYDKRIPFMYNIDFLLHFEKSVALQGNIGG
jgi:Tfp pilus assembly major pilin PilA